MLNVDLLILKLFSQAPKTPGKRNGIVFIDIFSSTCSEEILPYLQISLIVTGYLKTAELLVPGGCTRDSAARIITIS